MAAAAWLIIRAAWQYVFTHVELLGWLLHRRGGLIMTGCTVITRELCLSEIRNQEPNI